MEVGPEHLTKLSKDISSTLGSHLGEFRKTAADHNKNVGNIVKDISKTFAQQRRDIGDLHDSLEEANQHSQKTATKVDQTNNILQETITLQNNILSELRNMNNSMNTMNTNMQNNSAPSLLSSLFDSKFGTVLKGLGALGAVVGAGYLANNEYNNYNQTNDANQKKMAGLGGVGAIPASGNLAQNQQEAYKAAIGEGLSEKSSKILVANMSGESLKNPGLKRWDRFHYSQGIVQWDDKRSAEIKQHFGKFPQEMTVAEQTKAAIWEMKTHKEFARAWEGMTNEQLSDQERMYAVVKHYEKPQYAEKDTGTRLGYLKGLKVGGGTTAQATPESKPEPMASGKTPAETPQATKQEEVKPHRHEGIISGALAKAEEKNAANKVDKSSLTGKDLGGVNNDLVTKLTEAASEFKAKTGQTVQVTSGFRSQDKQQQLYQAYITGKSHIPANPPGKSNHETGNAVDVSSAQARAMDSMGILAKHGLARPLGERDPVHIQLAGTGTSQGSYGAGGKGSPTTPGSEGKSDATPEAQSPVTPSMGGGGEGGAGGGETQKPPEYDINNDASVKSFFQGMAGGGGMGGMGGMMGAMGGMGGMGGMATMMPGMMGGMGGMGGMMGMAMPMLQQLMSGGMGAQLTGQKSQEATMNTAMINATQIENQLNESQTREALVQHFRNSNKNAEEQSIVQGNSGQLTVNDYNGPEDIGWPDWAAHLGISGSKYKELDKIKIY